MSPRTRGRRRGPSELWRAKGAERRDAAGAGASARVQAGRG
jgi:hypothetical protein